MNVVSALLGYRTLAILRNRLVQVGLLSLILVLTAACSSETAPAPDFELTLYGTETRQAGETLRMSDLKGKPVVLNFWFPSCPALRR